MQVDDDREDDDEVSDDDRVSERQHMPRHKFAKTEKPMIMHAEESWTSKKCSCLPVKAAVDAAAGLG
jgi:hypothetical protein